MEHSTDYYRVASAIQFLRQHNCDQPSLEQLAEHLGLSSSRTQRLFSRWAGVSPKRFSQYLTVEHAKQKIHQTDSLFELSLDCGLSGSGRLHDLFVTMEAMSPGEFKQAANGVDIFWGCGETPFGTARVAFAQRGICHLAFLDDDNAVASAEPLRYLWPAANLVYQPDQAAALLKRIFAKEQPEQPLTLWLSGTNFQIQVWRALLRIPFGGALNYQRLAAALGNPKASRAVGTAVAKNPLAYLIPCHRVLRESGEIGQYHWGSDRKAALIGWEAAQQQAACDS